MIAAQKKKRATLKEYLSLPEGAPYELIGGMLVMTPSPLVIHQRISRKIESIISSYVEKNDLGEVFYAPMDIHLDEENVVQPDILFISKNKKEIINEYGWITGPPDLIIEILSQSNASKDSIEKKELYERFGVSEYWIIDPMLKTVYIYVYEDSRYKLSQKAEAGAKIISKQFPGLVIDLAMVF